MYGLPLVNFANRGGISHSKDNEVAVKVSATKAGADGVPTSSIYFQLIKNIMKT